MPPHRTMCLNPWSLASAAVWEGYGTFGMWRLIGGSTSLRVGFGVCSLPHFQLSLCFLCVVKRDSFLLTSSLQICKSTTLKLRA